LRKAQFAAEAGLRPRFVFGGYKERAALRALAPAPVNHVVPLLLGFESLPMLDELEDTIFLAVSDLAYRECVGSANSRKDHCKRFGVRGMQPANSGEEPRKNSKQRHAEIELPLDERDAKRPRIALTMGANPLVLTNKIGAVTPVARLADENDCVGSARFRGHNRPILADFKPV
jgi:hypothetical protein